MPRGGRHTIIGNSAAGLSAIKAIRRSGDQRPIDLVSAEQGPAYSPVLTTYYIGGLIQRQGLFFVDDSFYRKYKVRTVFGRRVINVDPVKRQILLDDQTHMSYDRLLIATGASARPLPDVDPEAAGFVSTLRTIEDADRIKVAADQAREIVVIGAGLVSLQTIKAIWGKNIKITAVVGSGQVLSQQMDWESSTVIQRKLEAHRVDILFGRSVERVAFQDGRALVLTSYGERLPADFVVVGKGVRPNIDLVKDTSIDTGYGILVDERMRTTAEDVYAAGDVAEGLNRISGHKEVIATWFNACAQGEIAGLNLAGREARSNGQIRENITTILDLVVTSIGESNPRYGRYEELRYVDLKRSVIRKLFFDGPKMVGALLIGRFTDAGLIRHCIAEGVNLAGWKHRLATAPLDFGKLLYGQGFNWPQLSNL